MPFDRVVLQRTAECLLDLDALDARDVTTKDFRLEYGLQSPTVLFSSSDPEPGTWHRRGQPHRGGAWLWAHGGGRWYWQALTWRTALLELTSP